MSHVPILEMKGITKDFFGTRVLNRVNLQVHPGEIHALIGENGAGKSTLMNVLFGMPVIRDTGGFVGEIRLAGERAQAKSPFEAMALGIGMVHQEFMLLPGFTVTENIKLNRELTRHNPVSRIAGGRLQSLDIAAMREDARRAIDRLGLDLDEWVPVAGMPVGHMQFIEIAREIDKKDLRLLVMDEPTAVLGESEATLLLEALRAIAASGVGVLLITHRLHEVLEVADRITILRDGEVVASIPAADAELTQLAELMVGRKVERAATLDRTKEPDAEDVILQVRQLVVHMPGERVRGIDLDVHRGEILGIGGLAGHGKVGIANGIMGLYPVTGEIIKDGKPTPLSQPKASLAAGMAFVSEDRRGVGLLLDESLETNIAVTAMQVKGRFLQRNPLLPALSLRHGRSVRAFAEKMIKDLDIRCRGPDQVVRRLSGGNQQKVCIARAIALDPNLLLVSEPTRGIDVGAKNLVLDLLLRFNREMGMTIVMTSSELAELQRICDRIALVYGGRLVGIMPPDAPAAEFGLAMSGELRRKEVS